MRHTYRRTYRRMEGRTDTWTEIQTIRANQYTPYTGGHNCIFIVKRIIRLLETIKNRLYKFQHKSCIGMRHVYLIDDGDDDDDDDDD